MTTSHRTESFGTSAQRLLTAVRDGRRDRAQARAERRQLERELASYTTKADVDDLLASLRGQDEASAEVIRTLVLRNVEASRHPYSIAS